MSIPELSPVSRRADPTARHQQDRELLARLETAILDTTIKPHYQPIFGLDPHGIDALEVLARWDDDVLGPVPPARFIPLAEKHGLIQDLTSTILDQALADLAAWDRQGAHPSTRLCVNIAPCQLQDSGFTDQIRMALGKRNIAPERLEVEITEGTALDPDDTTTMNILEKLRVLGVTLAIDDFGTGYSSLSYLTRLPADSVKLDRSFMDCVDEGRNGRSLVLHIVKMAQAIGLKVVAEGIEKAQQLDFLRAVDCNSAQGFFLARPATADTTRRMLA